MQRINEIALRNVVPDVFVGDQDFENRPSQVWKSELTLERGKIYCVNAASGAGKTSLCSFLLGDRTDYKGEILFNNQSVRQYSIADWGEIRRHHIAYLPQELELFGELTALQNVLLKNRLTDYRSEADIRAMFELLEIDNRINRPCGMMSVGQKQRVAVVRALCQPFDFLVLDEPVSHLDIYNNVKIAELVVSESHRQEAAIMFTSVGNALSLEAPYIPLQL